MLHILLTILKILGLVLLVIVALILALILIILFVPIRYKLSGSKQEKVINGKAKITWLFGLLALVVSYKEKSIDYQVKILGINVLKLFKKKSEKKKSHKKNKAISSQQSNVQKVKEEVHSEKINEPKVESPIQTKEIKPADDILKKDEKKTKLIDKVKNIWTNIKERVKKIKLTIQNIYGKIKNWKEFLSDQRVKNAFNLLKKHFIKMFKHIMPKKIKGNITYGFDDPCKTGQILAGVSVFYPVYYKSLSLCPDFSQQVLNGDIYMRGRIYLGFFVKMALQIFFDSNIQYIIRTFRNKEES